MHIDKPSPMPCRAPVSSPSGANYFVYAIRDTEWDELWGGHTIRTSYLFHFSAWTDFTSPFTFVIDLFDCMQSRKREFTPFGVL